MRGYCKQWVTELKVNLRKNEYHFVSMSLAENYD